jgi:hypothetical protein
MKRQYIVTLAAALLAAPAYGDHYPLGNGQRRSRAVGHNLNHHAGRYRHDLQPLYRYDQPDLQDSDHTVDWNRNHHFEGHVRLQPS